MLPYPGIPYDYAPAWCFVAAEFCVLALLLVCFVHALRRDRLGLPYLLGGFLFGLALESMEVAGGSYTYGRFDVMLGHAPNDVPMWIGAGWGVIMYTARLFSDGLQLPPVAAAAMDTLLALNIDLGMDVVAYRTHMWHWPWTDTSRALTGQWFGIPYGNFVGWITVVFCYSVFARLFERLLTRRAPASIGRYAVAATLSLACSFATLFLTESFIFPWGVRYLHITSGIRLTLLTIALLAIVIANWPRHRGSAGLLPPVALWVPAWFHLFFAACFVVLGFYRENPWMTLAAAANILIGVAIHLYPFRIRARVRAASAA